MPPVALSGSARIARFGSKPFRTCGLGKHTLTVKRRQRQLVGAVSVLSRRFYACEGAHTNRSGFAVQTPWRRPSLPGGDDVRPSCPARAEMRRSGCRSMRSWPAMRWSAAASSLAIWPSMTTGRSRRCTWPRCWCGPPSRWPDCWRPRERSPWNGPGRSSTGRSPDRKPEEESLGSLRGAFWPRRALKGAGGLKPREDC